MVLTKARLLKHDLLRSRKHQDRPTLLCGNHNICEFLCNNLHFSPHPHAPSPFYIFQTCLPLKRAFPPGTKYVFKPFSWGEGLSLVRSLCTPWEALHGKNLATPMCLQGWYQVRFFGLIFGHSWGIGEGPGWHLVWYLSTKARLLI